ncbi:MAG: hypothetical protein LAO05_06005 [Acidobacteriia bacterium]|nr:hypothetical protein [Terriglobia bacterium]
MIKKAYPGLTVEAIRAREKALERFARWEEEHPATLTPAAAISAATALYDMLPAEGRVRGVDPSGVMALHAILSRIKPACR